MSNVIDRFASGFGRLIAWFPRGTERVWGAGYAMATGAVLSAFLFSLLLMLPLVGFVPLGAPTSLTDAVVDYLIYATGSLPVTLPSAFLAGVLVWRILPESVGHRGILGGLASATVGFLISAVVSVILFIGYGVVVDTTLLAPSIGRTVVSLVLLIPFVFLFLSWAILPVGAIVGGLYERTRRQLSQTD